MSNREALLTRLKGQDVVIPDLYPIFTDWVPVEINPNYPDLIHVSDKRLESIFADNRKLSALQASDFASFAATWWPKAQYEELKVLMYLIIWLFIWDDEIDEPTGCYSEDLDGAEQYRSRTIEFVLGCLKLTDHPGALLSDAQNKIIASFREIGEALANACTLAEAVHGRISHVHGAQFQRATSPAALRHSQRRRILELPYGYQRSRRCGCSSRVRDAVMRKDHRIKAIADETNIIVSIVNDLLSLKKEITKGCIDSIIPIYCAKGMSVQDAVEEAVQAIEASKSRFDEAAHSLLLSAQLEPLKYKHISDWIEGYQSLCMGNLVWSLATGRYGVSQYRMQSDGSVRFTL